MQSVSQKYFMEIHSDRKSIDVEIPTNPIDSSYPGDWAIIMITSLPFSLVWSDDLRFLIQNVLKLGSIRDIEYAQDCKTDKYMALVYFEHWNYNEDVKLFRHHMENTGHLDLYGISLLNDKPGVAKIFKTQEFALSYYFNYLHYNDYIRMHILGGNRNNINSTVTADTNALNQRVIQLTETLENVVKEHAMLKEQMERLPKPKTYSRYNDESPPALSLDDLVTDHCDNTSDCDDKTVSDTYTDSTDYRYNDESPPAFHPDEFAEHFTEEMENKIILDNAILHKDYTTIVNYFLKYEQCAADHSCRGCMFEEFCNDNNISGKMRNLLRGMLPDTNNKLSHDINHIPVVYASV
jgi:hypothetical protein